MESYLVTSTASIYTQITSDLHSTSEIMADTFSSQNQTPKTQAPTMEEIAQHLQNIQA
jgi:hypothetical protein